MCSNGLACSPSVAATSGTHLVGVGSGPCPEDGPLGGGGQWGFNGNGNFGGPGVCPVFELRTEVILAVRTTDMGNNHVWYARYDVPQSCTETPLVTWTDASALDRDGLSFAADGSDVAIVRFTTGISIFAITSRGTVRQFNVDTQRWTDVGSMGAPFTAPSLIPHWHVSPGGIAAIYVPPPGPELRVIVGAHAPGFPQDDLFIARTTDGSTWGWSDMIMGIGTPGSPYRNSIATNFRPTSAFPGIDQVIYSPELSGDRLLFCRVPPLGPIVDAPFNYESCMDVLQFRMPHPADMAPVRGIPAAGIGRGRDTVGPAVTGEIFADPGWLCDHPGCGCGGSSPCDPDAPSALRAFTPGDIAGTGYVYEMEAITSRGTSFVGIQPIWHNLLAPNDLVTAPFGGMTAEFGGAEFFGRVALADTSGNVAVSLDDGVTWVRPANPFTSVGSDANLSYDAAGDLWYSRETASPGVLSVEIARIPHTSPTGPFHPAIVVPGSRTTIPPSRGVRDRPWMIARRDRTNFVFVTWQGPGAFNGQITYCSGAVPCDQPDAAWCPITTLPAQCEAHGGCLLTQTGDGSVWLALGQPLATRTTAGCSPPPGMRAVGISRIINLPALGPNCVSPQFSLLPECIYYTLEPQISPAQSPLGQDFPSNQDGWGLRFEGAQDSNDLALAVRDWVDVATGMPCTSLPPSNCASVPGQPFCTCRPEVRLLRRDAASGRWLGPNSDLSLLAPFLIPRFQFSANSDQAPVPLQPTSHVLPAIAFFDYAQLDAYWMDFRVGGLIPQPTVQCPPSLNTPFGCEYLYQYRLRQTRYSGATLIATDETPWTATPSGVSFPLQYVRGATYDPYLHIDTTATEHLHTHSMHRLLNGPPQSIPSQVTADVIMSLLWSPRTPPR